jgi:Flp pilus assembly protein TadD
LNNLSPKRMSTPHLRIESNSSASRMTWGLALALLAGTVLLYWPVAHYAFINYDDPDYVVENYMIQQGFSWENLAWAFTRSHSANWHPLTWLSHTLDWQIYGSNAGGHHVTNLLFHAANALLLFWVIRLMTGKLWRSALVAGLFAWHPLHVESVAWVAERKDVLSTFFGLLSLGAYAKYCRIPKSKSRSAFYGVSLFCFACSLMSKPMLVTFPFLLLLLDYWPLERLRLEVRSSSSAIPRIRHLRSAIVEKLPFFAMSLVSSVITLTAQQQSMASLNHISPGVRVGTAAVAYVTYLCKMACPTGLAVFYPYPLSGSFSTWQEIFSLTLLAGITACAWRWKTRQPWLVVGWLWYLGTLVPVIGLVQVGSQAMADRYTYLPMLGVCIMVVWMIAEWATHSVLRQRTGFIAGTAVMLTCLFISRRQMSYWQNSETLFRHALAVTRNNSVAHFCLGSVLADKGQVDEAIPHFREALRIDPEDPETHNSLGSTLASRGELGEAIEHYSQALRIQPDNVGSLNNLGAALFSQGKINEAVDCYQRALRIKPGQPSARSNLAVALRRLGRTEEALWQYREALRIKPDFIEALDNLAWLLATGHKAGLRNGREAVQLASRLMKLTKNPDAATLDTLAAAYAENEQFEEAVQTIEQALALAHTTGQMKLARSLEERRDLYRARKPFHEP